ncbi:MAG: TolC family protein [Opitutus sp.]
MTPFQQTIIIPLLAVGLLGALAGCATVPASLPNVQQHLTSRSEVQAAWPQSEAEKADADHRVQSLLEQPLTTDSAVQIAVINNRTLRATFEEIGLSRADLMAASRLHNPTLGASVRWPDHAPRGPNVGLSLAVDLLDNLFIPLRRNVAGDQLAQAERRVAYEVLSLSAEVKTAVLTVQARQQFRARASAIAEVNDAAADLAQRQYDAGNINRLELANVQVSAQEAKLEMSRAETQAGIDREKLNRLLGLSGPQTNWTLAAELPALPEHEMDFSRFEELALDQRLDLAAAKGQVALAERALTLKRNTRFLPASVDVGAETEREVDGSRITGPTLELGLPIFDQGQADLARLSAEHRRAVANYEGMTNDIRSEVRELRDTLLAARATSEFYNSTLLPQRRLLLKETLLHYNAMQKSNYELLAAKERLLAVEREAIEALRDYWIARAQLERAFGGKLPPIETSAPPAEVAPTSEQPEHHHLAP